MALNDLTELCGMNPAASVKAADFNPQETYFVHDHQALAQNARRGLQTPTYVSLPVWRPEGLRY
ncbi:MAG TPA: hypothetical protein VJ578_04260, partial [Dehalococcoidia bacterium]|nr:hypothetical protein [Dehalococcoidia bacterium]